MNDRELALAPPYAIKSIEDAALIGFEDNNHALISPSGASRWAKCVGSLVGIHNHRKTAPDNMASIEGTTAHWLLEFALTHQVCPTEVSMQTIGELPDSLHDEVVFWCERILSKSLQTQEVKDRAVELRDMVCRLNFDMDMRLHVKKVYDSIMSYVYAGYKMWPEMRVSLKKYFGHSQCDGSSDTVLVRGDHLIIADLKYGVAEEVFPEENAQLSLYGLGACAYVEETAGCKIERVSLVVCQPRVNNRVWDEWEINKQWLLDYAGKMKIASLKALIAIANPELITPEMYVPSEKSCKYCHRKIDCESRRESVLAEVKNAFMAAGAEVPNGQIAPVTTLDVSKIDNITLSKIMNAAPFIISFLKDVEKETFLRVNKGENVDGRKLVKGRLSRDWAADPEQMFKTFISLGLSFDDVMETKLKSPAKLESVAMPNHVRNIVTGLIKNSHGSPVVALKNDRREAIAVTSAKELFKNYENGK